jgi:hypothetical protein
MAYSKRQNSVEGSTYGSELVAMRQAIDLVKGLRYKLRMFGIPIEGPMDVFCDNESVFKNVSYPNQCYRRNSIVFRTMPQEKLSQLVLYESQKRTH